MFSLGEVLIEKGDSLMLSTIHGDTCNVPSMQHLTANSERLDNNWCIKQNINQFHLSHFDINIFYAPVNFNPIMDN